MTDFHSHTLPSIDDGSKSEEQSYEMLSALLAMGFDEVIMTPHFYPENQSINEFCRSRAGAYGRLMKYVSKQKGAKLPRLSVGAEVYLTPHFFSEDEEDFKKLTINGNGKTMLTEMEYTDILTDFTVNALKKLVYNIGITPVLAHIERYPFMRDEKTVQKLLDIGCRAQINVTSLTPFFMRKKLLKYIKKGYISEIGSDIHSPDSIEKVKNGLGELSNKYRSIIEYESESISAPDNIQTFFN